MSAAAWIGVVVLYVVSAVLAAFSAWLSTRAGYRGRVRELERRSVEREHELERLQAHAASLARAIQNMQVPPSIAAVVVQRYRMDATCPNCHALVEHGCVAFCKKCDFEHETLRRDPVVRAARAFVQVGRDHSQTAEKFKALAAMLETGGWLK